MKQALLCMLLLAAACHTPSPHRQAARATDSLVMALKNAVNPLLNNNQTAEAQHILDSLKPEVDNINDYRLTGAWLRCLSVRTELDGQYDSAKTIAQQALRLAQQHDTAHREMIGANIQLSEVLRLQQSYDSALILAKDAYYLAGKYDSAGLPLICIRLAQLYNAIHDQPQRGRYLWEGYRRSTSPAHKNVLANHIADYYEQVGKRDSAIWFLRSLDKDTTFNNPYYFATRYENLGTLLTQQGQYTEGLQYQLKAVAISRSIGALDAKSYYDLAMAYSRLPGDEHAAVYLDTAMLLATQHHDTHLVTDIWNAKAGIARNKAQYADAYQYKDSAFDAYQTETDSSFVLKARELETKYAVRAKDEKIASLAFAASANQKIRNQQLTIIVAMAIVLIALFTVFSLLWKRRQLKVQLHDAELEQQLLRSRMEPHFIFNTLAVLQSFIRNEGRERSLQYLGSFSRLLRLNLENSRKGWVLLKQEIEALQNYLSLQATNLENRFDYRVEVDERLYKEAIMVPPMLIQPIVENAVIHGVAKVEYKARIAVVVKKQGNILQCTVDDNGAGINEATDTKKASHATQLLKDRLAIIARQTKQPATLEITDKLTVHEGTGVRVVLTMGLRKGAA